MLRLAVVHLALQFLRLAQLARRFHEVFVDHVVTFRANGEHAGLGAYIAQISSVETVTKLDDSIEIWRST